MNAADFKKVYAQHYGKLYYWILGMTKRPETAEDIVAGAFLSAWEKRDQLRDPCAVKNWVYSIAYNAFKMSLRRPELESLDDPNNTEDLIDPFDFTEELARYSETKRLHGMLRGLRQKHYAAVMRFLDGKPCQGTWGSRLCHARKKLAALAA